jgi:hypothetical protein
MFGWAGLEVELKAPPRLCMTCDCCHQQEAYAPPPSLSAIKRRLELEHLNHLSIWPAFHTVPHVIRALHIGQS